MNETSDLDFIRYAQVVWVQSPIKVTNHWEPKVSVTCEGPKMLECFKLNGDKIFGFFKGKDTWWCLIYSQISQWKISTLLFSNKETTFSTKKMEDVLNVYDIEKLDLSSLDRLYKPCLETLDFYSPNLLPSTRAHLLTHHAQSSSLAQPWNLSLYRVFL